MREERKCMTRIQRGEHEDSSMRILVEPPSSSGTLISKAQEVRRHKVEEAQDRREVQSAEAEDREDEASERKGDEELRLRGERMSEESLRGERTERERAAERLDEEGALTGGGARGEKVAELLCRRGNLKNLGLALSWMILQGGRSQLGESWLWGKVASMSEWVVSGQLLGSRSLFPFPHVWKRLESKLSGTLLEDVFRESFWTEEDYVEGWTLASVKFCQQMHGGSLGFSRSAARKQHWLCLKSIPNESKTF